MSVLNEMGVIGTPSRPIIMAKKNSEFFTSSDATTGDDRPEGKMPECGVGESTVIDGWKI